MSDVVTIADMTHIGQGSIRGPLIGQGSARGPLIGRHLQLWQHQASYIRFAELRV